MPARENITPNLINSLLERFTGDFPSINNLTLLFSFKIDAGNYKCKGLTFKNCEFSHDIFITDVNLLVGIKFIDCIFHSRVSLSKVKANGFDPRFNPNSNNLLFENCTGLDLVNFNECEFGREVKFLKCLEFNQLVIQTSKIDSLYIEQSNIEKIDIDHFDSRMGIRIEKSKVTGQGRYFDCRGGGFSFLQSEFLRDQSLWACSVDSIVTNDGTFEQELKIKACPSKQGYTFAGTLFKKSVSINTNDIANHIEAAVGNLWIENADFQGGLEFIGSGTNGSAPDLGICTVKCSAQTKGNITFEEINIGELNLQGTNVSSNISLRKCRIKKFNINFFTNLGKLYLSDLQALDREGSKFEINKSTMGTTILLNVDLASFSSFEIWHSQLTELIFTDIIWFKPESLNKDSSKALAIGNLSEFKLTRGADPQDAISNRTKKEVYRQLKYAASKQGDSVQSLIFQGLEMQAYNLEIGQYELTGKSAGNRIMMSLNSSNDYGNNWIKPIVILLLLNMLFFFCITLAQSGQFCLCPARTAQEMKNTLQVLWNNNGAYWALLNPVRRLSDVYGTKEMFSGTTIFLDYLDRIIASYFIFQTVSAFRKYSK